MASLSSSLSSLYSQHSVSSQTQLLQPTREEISLEFQFPTHLALPCWSRDGRHLRLQPGVTHAPPHRLGPWDQEEGAHSGCGHGPTACSKGSPHGPWVLLTEESAALTVGHLPVHCIMDPEHPKGMGPGLGQHAGSRLERPVF